MAVNGKTKALTTTVSYSIQVSVHNSDHDGDVRISVYVFLKWSNIMRSKHFTTRSITLYLSTRQPVYMRCCTRERSQAFRRIQNLWHVSHMTQDPTHAGAGAQSHCGSHMIMTMTLTQCTRRRSPGLFRRIQNLKRQNIAHGNDVIITLTTMMYQSLRGTDVNKSDISYLKTSRAFDVPIH